MCCEMERVLGVKRFSAGEEGGKEFSRRGRRASASCRRGVGEERRGGEKKREYDCERKARECREDGTRAFFYSGWICS